MKKHLFAILSVLLFVEIFATASMGGFVHAQNFTFNNDLRLGATGTDVVNLQTWLIANGFDIPSISSGANVKGYYGFQTMSAVMAYQKSVGLPTYGYFGPLTRARINAGNGGGSRGQSLQILSPNGGETWQIGTQMPITWGVSSGLASQTADIRLEFPLPACAQPGQPIRCMVMTRAPLLIAKNVSLLAQQYLWTVGNVSDLSGANATVASAGQYKVQICPTNGSDCEESDNVFTISNSTQGGGTGSPVISGVDAPTTLVVGQVGTWVVHASDPANGTLSYYVNWGDQGNCSYPYTCMNSAASPQYVQTSTFTHTYSGAGTYKVTIQVMNVKGLVAVTTATVVVNANTVAGPLSVVSPNGGEIWQRGTTQSIIWTSPYYIRPTYADLKLVPYQAPCTSGACPMYMLAPYTIATGVGINQNSYSWVVGANVSGMTIPDGQYSVQICETGSGNCVSSAQPFTITSGATSNLPDVNIVSPNGGEAWYAGANQGVVVNVTGNPAQVGNVFSFALVDSSNRQTPLQQYGTYSGTTNSGLSVSVGSTGQRSFTVFVPTNIVPGMYRLFVNMYGTNSSTGALQQQAYDYSDGYFTVYSSTSLLSPSLCPAGYTCTPNH